MKKFFIITTIVLVLLKENTIGARGSKPDNSHHFAEQEPNVVNFGAWLLSHPEMKNKPHSEQIFQYELYQKNQREAQIKALDASRKAGLASSKASSIKFNNCVTTCMQKSKGAAGISNLNCWCQKTCWNPYDLYAPAYPQCNI